MTSSPNLTTTSARLRLPDFIGVGPPRTGTTWLHEALTGHVGLPSGIKETDFFLWRYNQGLEWYAAHFRDCPPDRPIGEFSASYFAGAETRQRISRHIPHCKIICTLRHPVERTYSHYRKIRAGAYFCGNLEECLEKPGSIAKWSRYATHVKAWRNVFGTENVLVLIQDDLKANPQNFLNQACDFIGIARIPLPDPPGQSRKVNAVPNYPRYPRLARAARIVRDGLQKRGDYAFVNMLKRTGLRKWLFSGGPLYEPIRPETAARLRDFFLPEVEELEQMLGRDLSQWKSV